MGRGGVGDLPVFLQVGFGVVSEFRACKTCFSVYPEITALACGFRFRV